MNESKEENISSKKPEGPKYNNMIKVKEVRVIDENGEMLGVMQTFTALQTAKEKGLDLVEISPNAEPPVCKFLDFGKYRFELQKKVTEAKKKQKTQEVKEIQVRPNIGIGDLNVKKKHIEKFLMEDSKVKVAVHFKGRELSNTGVGEKILKEIIEEFKEIASCDTIPKMDSKTMAITLSPKRRA